jgi:hypothetical protein
MPVGADRSNPTECRDPYDCLYVQNDWTPGNAGYLALPYPLGGSYAITEFKIPLGRNRRLRLETVHETDPASDTYTMTGEVIGSGAASDYALEDDVAHLPLHQGDTLALYLPQDAIIYTNARGEAGDGTIAYVPQETMTYTYQAQGQPDAGTLDFAVKVEPDADGDGFGDETQDNCPGFPGTDDGCGPGGKPVPAPAPLAPAPQGGTVGGAAVPRVARLSALRLSGTKLSYTLTTRLSRVRAKLERRRSGGRWHAYATRTLAGAKGTHTTRLPRHHKGDRLVITAAGHTIKIITLPR